MSKPRIFLGSSGKQTKLRQAIMTDLYFTLPGRRWPEITSGCMPAGRGRGLPAI